MRWVALLAVACAKPAPRVPAVDEGPAVHVDRIAPAPIALARVEYVGWIDEDRLVVAGGDEVAVFQAVDGEKVWSVAVDEVTALAIGERIAVGTRGRLVTFSLDGQELASRELSAQQLVWAPSGALFALTANQVVELDGEKLDQQATYLIADRTTERFAVSPDGIYLALSDGREVHVHDLYSGTFVGVIARLGGFGFDWNGDLVIGVHAWHAPTFIDSDLIVDVEGGGSDTTFRHACGALLGIRRAGKITTIQWLGSERSLRFGGGAELSPDCTAVAVFSEHRVVPLAFDERGVDRLGAAAGHVGAIKTLVVSTDGSTLVSWDWHTTIARTLANDDDVRILGTDVFIVLAVSADGSAIAMATSGAMVLCTDLGCRDVEVEQNFHPKRMDFDADGTLHVQSHEGPLRLEGDPPTLVPDDEAPPAPILPDLKVDGCTTWGQLEASAVLTCEADTLLVLHDLETGTSSVVLTELEGVSAVATSAARRAIFVGTNDGAIDVVTLLP